MSSRLRSCVECPKCHTRYLIGSSPYYNGSYIVAYPPSGADLLRLYCTCGDLLTSHVFKFSDLKMHAISEWAEKRGYGSPEEIVLVQTATRKAG